MTDTATNTTAPAAPASAPDINQPVAAGSFHEFQAQVAERAQQRAAARAAAPATTPLARAQAAGRGEAPPSAAPAAAAAPPPVAQPPHPQKAPDPLQSLQQPGGEPTDPQQTPEAEPQAQTQDPADPNAPPQFTQEDVELLAKAKAWLAGDTLPPEFATKLMELKNGDTVEYETIAEVQGARMRQADYQRHMNELTTMKEQVTREIEPYRKHFEQVFNDEKDGAMGAEALYEVFTRNGKHAQLDRLYEMMDRVRNDEMDQAKGYAIAVAQRNGIQDWSHHLVKEAYDRKLGELREGRAARDRARSLEFENQQLKAGRQARQQEEQNAAHWETERRKLGQLRPRAFEAMGLNHEDPISRDHFDSYLGAMIRQQKLNAVTPELVYAAARAAKERMQDETKAREAKARAAAGGGQQQAKPFTGQLGAGGGPMTGNKPKQWDAESFAKHFGVRSLI